MTVKEFIEQLKKYDPALQIYFEDRKGFQISRLRLELRAEIEQKPEYKLGYVLAQDGTAIYQQVYTGAYYEIVKRKVIIIEDEL